MLCVITLISCQDKVICPAYQSTYILDDSTRSAYFSYVWQLDDNTRTQFIAQENSGDSTSSNDSLGVASAPKIDYYAYAGEKIVPWRETKRTKYGIVKPVFMPIKKYRMRTAPMENVLKPKPEPVSSNFVAEQALDSASFDSLSLAASDTFKMKPIAEIEEEKKGPKFLYGYDPSDIFNVEQLYYNKYFSYLLIDNRPEPEPQPVAVDSLSSDSTQAKEPFFKRLFKKKNKEEDTEEQEPEEDESEPPVEATTEEEPEEGENE